jgi:hypothetical protein
VIDPNNLRVEAWQPQSIKADPVVEKFYAQMSEENSSLATLPGAVADSSCETSGANRDNAAADSFN